MTDEQERKLKRLSQCVCKLGQANTLNAEAVADLQTQIDDILSSSPTTVGGQEPFTADGIATVFNIVHNAGFIPGPNDYWTLTTSEPIPNNLLNRTITFPDINTMRITFAFAPIVGEDANYVYSLTKVNA